MNNKIMIVILTCTILPGIYAMDPVELPEPREIEQAPELARVKPRIQDIVLLQALKKGYYRAASKIMNAGTGRTALTVEELRKPKVAEGVLQAALRENHPGTIRALVACKILSNQVWKDILDSALNKEDVPNLLPFVHHLITVNQLIDANAFSKEQLQDLFASFVVNMKSKPMQNRLRNLLASNAKTMIDLEKGIPYKVAGYKYYKTALKMAIDAALPNMVELLLQFGASPNEQSEDGETPLMHAVNDINMHDPNRRQEKTKIIELLLAHPKIDMSLKDCAGKTVYDYTSSNTYRYWDIADLISDKMKEIRAANKQATKN